MGIGFDINRSLNYLRQNNIDQVLTDSEAAYERFYAIATYWYLNNGASVTVINFATKPVLQHQTDQGQIKRPDSD